MFNNSNEPSSYVKATNKGAYLAYYIMTYMYKGTVYQTTTPYIPVLQSFSVQFPIDAREIWFYGLMCGPYFICSSGTGRARTPICYEFYGTVFNPTCERVDC